MRSEPCMENTKIPSEVRTRHPFEAEPSSRREKVSQPRATRQFRNTISNVRFSSKQHGQRQHICSVVDCVPGSWRFCCENYEILHHGTKSALRMTRRLGSARLTSQSWTASCHATSFSMLSILRLRSLMSAAMSFMQLSAARSGSWSGCSCLQRQGSRELH